MKINQIKSREIFDSRGYTTIEAMVILENGKCGIGAVPSGASTGSKEALELRDGDKNYCLGKGVLKAVKNVNDIIFPVLKGTKCDLQKEIDQKMIDLDGTQNKEKLGANAILAVSIACAKAAANAKNIQLYQYLSENFDGKLSLPCPMINIINGGKHADNMLDIQEFMIMPIGAKNFKNAMINSATIFHNLKKCLSDKGFQTNVGDEGGFAPALKSTYEAIEFLIIAIEKSGFKIGEDFVLALDCAASEFFNQNTKKYYLKGENLSLDHDEMIEKYTQLIEKYPIVSIEDSLAEDDFEGWKKITAKLGNKIQIVGDDLFVTNPTILSEGIEQKMANALLVKPNQIGTLTETFEAIKIAEKAGYNRIISHRSGETEDTTIAHIAVASNAGQIKTGSMCRSDRMAKYNELIRIEDFDQNIKYSGKEFLKL